MSKEDGNSLYYVEEIASYVKHKPVRHCVYIYKSEGSPNKKKDVNEVIFKIIC